MSDIICDRKKQFSSLEKDLFVKLIDKYNSILTCKKTNSTSVLRKKQTWIRIQDEFNSSPIVSQKAAVKQLTKLWYNMKAKAREAKTRENVRFLTCGGPSVEDMDTIDAKVIATDKNILTNIKIDIDSDVNDSNMLLGDDNDEAWRRKNCEILDIDLNLLPENSQNNSSSFYESAKITSNITKTDEKIITRDEIELNNTSISSSRITKTAKRKKCFGKKYINKIDLLKIKILEEELEHRRRIHAEELKIKIKERETKEKLWDLEIKEKEKKIYKG